MTQIIDILKKELPESAVIQGADMKEYTSFKAGGRADILVIPENEEQLMYALKTLAGSGAEYMVMGNGTNILVKDGGYRGVIVKIGDAFSDIRVEGEKLIAGSGALMTQVANEALDAGLEGFEFASGIPGSIGGAAFMNAGAYGGEIVQILESVRVAAKDGSRIFTMTNEELELSYRHSKLYETGDIVLEVTLKLKKGDKLTIRNKIRELAEKRNSKQPVDKPSAGSFFKRPEGYYAGKLIQDAGLKGLTVGGAQVSELHSGFVINTGNATASDIVQLKEVVQATVKDKFGVELQPEVRIIGEDE
ncbi:MAG: UDP-N-acetylmuramate dehydrogenase [Firmicutes bacterium]|nr:UDP-N-acetylmuramate dehydrogenase [Bacillota bacterium]